jgi:hypothetical protein
MCPPPRHDGKRDSQLGSGFISRSLATRSSPWAGVHRPRARRQAHSPVTWHRSYVRPFDLARARQAAEKQKRSVGKEEVMSKYVTPLRNAAIAGIAAASLSLAIISVAPAQQGADGLSHPNKHLAWTHHAKWRKSEISPKIVYNVAADQPDCTWPYTRMSPPCMSTWPEGDPNYHGTFRGNQWE